ncbi:MAG: hypothetical protein CMK89_06425 [Pseudomonadales bacterium]|nr:hypothetical protein [Pseudomonadales bacterium]
MSALSPENLISYIPVILPLLMAAAGWTVVKVARLLALWPRFFIGIRPMFGWQGYFHANSQLYVNHWSKELFEKASGLQQIFEYLGPEKIITHQLTNLRPQIDGIIDDVMNEDNAVMWENLPVVVKNRFYMRAHRLLPRIIDDIIEELGDGLTRILSYQRLLEHAEKQHPGTLQRIYDILSRRTFNGMAHFCAMLGFGLGCIQLLVAVLLQISHIEYWVISSALTVFFFFWICQHWIQYPYHPIRVWHWHIRSPYTKFRDEQDRELAELLAQDVVSIRNLFNTLLNGVRSRRTHSIIRKRVAILVEDINVRTFVQLTVGPIGYLELKNTLTDKLTDAIIEPLEDEHFNRERSTLVQHHMHQRLGKLSDGLFYSQLKRIVEPLSIIGGIGGFLLGAVAGFLQWLLLYF